MSLARIIANPPQVISLLLTILFIPTRDSQCRIQSDPFNRHQITLLSKPQVKAALLKLHCALHPKHNSLTLSFAILLSHSTPTALVLVSIITLDIISH